MSERSIIENRIKRKTSEMLSLEEKLKAAKIYVQALQDVLKAIDKGGEHEDAGEASLRKGSAVAQAKSVILQQGKPIHIDELLVAMGKDVTRDTKASLTGSLAAYVRREEIFTRPAPSTFGLIELGHFENEAPQDNGPPEGFGGGSSPDLDEDSPF